MQHSISDGFDDNSQYTLELDLKGVNDDDYRNDLIAEIITSTMRTIVEYVQGLPENNDYQCIEDGCLSTKDLNKCLNEFKANDLDKFLDLLKNNIQTLRVSD